MKVDHYESGSLYGVHYEMEEGESIPKHAHQSGEGHNICVLKGSVAFMTDHPVVLAAGDVFDFDGREPHIITALKPSRLLNLYLFGKPESAKNLTDAEKHFTV
jgi:quercetin dioxygenase-like cupin family protein